MSESLTINTLNQGTHTHTHTHTRLGARMRPGDEDKRDSPEKKKKKEKLQSGPQEVGKEGGASTLGLPPE